MLLEDEGRRRWVAALARPLDLTQQEREALERSPMVVRRFRADVDIFRAGDDHRHCYVILDGFAWRYQMTENAKRQVLSIHMPGDMPDLSALHLERLDNSLGTLSPCLVGFIAYEHVLRIAADMPAIWEALWRATLLDAALARAWLVNIGNRSGLPRTAHLLCELYTLARQRGLADGKNLPLPITQSQLADALGITAVHVNRAFRVLREAGFVST